MFALRVNQFLVRAFLGNETRVTSNLCHTVVEIASSSRRVGIPRNDRFGRDMNVPALRAGCSMLSFSAVW